jgi:photosystem II stability/assembly factor-like uncharacterized protein
VYSFGAAVGRNEPATLFAVSPTGHVFKSVDTGESWAEVAVPVVGITTALVSDPVHPETLYFGSGAGIFKSMDGGANWKTANAGLGPLSIYTIVVAPSVPSVLYVAGPGSFAKSTNGGETWTPLTMKFRSANYTSFGGYAVTSNVQTLTVAPFDAAKVYAGTGDGVYKSTDGGATWTRTGGAMDGQSVCSVFVDRGNPAVLYATATSDGKAFKTTDGGDTWEELKFGFPRLGGCGMVMDPADSSILFATSEAGTIMSTDAGKSWQKQYSGTGAKFYPEIGLFDTSLASDPDNASILYAASPVGILKSFDKGHSWTVVSSASHVKGLNRFLFDPHNPTVIYAEGKGLYKSVDRGRSWKPINAGLHGLGAGALVFDPTDSSTLYVVNSRYGIYKSTNGGKSWHPTGSKE